MKKYVKNIILVMSGGKGARFGSDCPKQYCTMKGRLVIDYVMDECRKCKQVDEIVVVAAEEYVNFIIDRYHVSCVSGGATRPESVANGLQFIYHNYECEKLIITNAVCPLATGEQYDKYFTFLNEYDYVLTTWKLAPALHRFDGEKVDRDDFFNVMEPDAYRFHLLYHAFDFKNLHKYIFHNMPGNSKAYYCFDYPYTMKLTYFHDLKLLEVLYDDLVEKPQETRTLQIVNDYLSSDGTQGIGKWVSNVQEKVKELAHKYEVISYTMNSQTEANIVYEAWSKIYGSIVIKFTPSKYHFYKEYLYYQLADKGIMPEIIDYDEDFNVLVIKMVKPGVQVKFDTNNEELREFYDKIDKSMISINKIKETALLPSIMSEFCDYVKAAERYTFEYDFRKLMERKACEVWKIYFESSKKYFLHRDLHRRNILKAEQGILAIDPRGAIGPRAFEYVIPFVIELREYPEFNKEKYDEMFQYFNKYVPAEELKAALFIFFVYKMNDYTFQKNDEYRLAAWCKKCIMNIFFKNSDKSQLGNLMPEGLERIKNGQY